METRWKHVDRPHHSAPNSLPSFSAQWHLSTRMSLYKRCLHLIKSLSCTPSFCSIVKFLCQENRRLVVLGHVNVSSGISFFSESQNMSCTGYLRRLRFKNIKFSYLNLQFGWQDGIGIANQGVKKDQRPPGRSPQPLQRAVVAPGRNGTI